MAITKGSRPSKSAAGRTKAKKTLENLVEEYLIHHQSQNHSPKTIEWHKTALSHLLRYLANEGITDPQTLDTGNLRRFVVWLSDQESVELRRGQVSTQARSKRTINTYSRSVHAFCRWLFDESYTASDVTDHFVLPKYGKPLIRIMEEDEFVKMLDACDDKRKPRAYMLRDQAIMWVLLDTGMRLAEITELTLKQINFHSGVLVAHGKFDKERRIALGKNAIAMLRRYIDQGRGDFCGDISSDQIFLGEAGPLTVRGIQQIIMRAKRRAGLTDEKISAHIFRHTFAVHYLMLGGDPFSLQELLGHEDMATIKNYMHLNDLHIQTQKRKFSPGDHVAFAQKPKRRKDFR